ncbi:MAG: hypothetical protein D3914_07550, partial [Candidatus Electrothrix sp. LOE2]|nr:hypothetical protein [Candidatus Electrothrix sp. LOE2]
IFFFARNFARKYYLYRFSESSEIRQGTEIVRGSAHSCTEQRTNENILLFSCNFDNHILYQKIFIVIYFSIQV